MAVDELSTPYHPAPAYFDDAAPHRNMPPHDVETTTCWQTL
eukprot:COSAG01_NODE_4898_length_4644_cov_14.434763_3_plen_41_part_00